VNLVCISALLTTTMMVQKEIIDALVRCGLGSIKSYLGLEEMIEVSYRDGEDLGEISWRDTLSNYLKYSASPQANTGRSWKRFWMP